MTLFASGDSGELIAVLIVLGVLGYFAYCGLAALVNRLLGSGPPDWYVNIFNGMSATLGYPIAWDQDSPKTCILEVEAAGRPYAFCVTLITDDLISFVVFSKTKANDISHQTRAELIRRNQRLRYGKWIITTQSLFLATEMKSEDLSFDRISDAIQTMVGEVAVLDHRHLGSENP